MNIEMSYFLDEARTLVERSGIGAKDLEKAWGMAEGSRAISENKEDEAEV